MVNMIAGNVLGNTIQAAEIDDNSITGAKLISGLKLITSGALSSNTVTFNVTAKKIMYLFINAIMSNAGDGLQIRFNGDTGNNYTAVRAINGSFEEQNSFSFMLVNYSAASHLNTATTLQFNGVGNNHNVTVVGGSNATGLDNITKYISGAHIGAADVSSITIMLNGAGTFTGKYALYYVYEVE